MIEKIDIENFGSYRQYEWKKNVGNHEGAVFKQLNIIYGRNYSGKTTLSRIFKCLEDGKTHPDYFDPNFVIHLKDGGLIHQNTLDDFLTKYSMRVYNTDFVKTNLSWFSNQDGSIKPFTLLGEKNIGIEKRISEIDKELGSVDEKQGVLFELSQIINGYLKIEKEVKEKK